jgi:mannosyltransferase OCH1-like enzyme
MIPKIIWQTYKDSFDMLPQYMKDAAQTWRDKNPEYEWRYMDDEQAAEFILTEFGEEWHNIFINAPVGVMRGDIWRYMIIYKYGGVYADLDTECWKPISSWMMEDKDMIVCPETSEHFCQWTFAASPNHPVIKSVLDQIKLEFINPDYNAQHFVHNLTGPAVWTRGINYKLNVNVKNLIDDYLLINSSENAKLYKFYCYGGEQWRIFHFEAVKHLYGSQTWKEGYVQWIEDPLVKGKR